jgi:uncharacterized protein (DUF1015 family)
MFGIGFAISLPLIAIALLLDDIAGLIGEVKRRFKLRKKKKMGDDVEFDEYDNLDALKMEHMLSVARSRKSADVEWVGGMQRISREIERPRTREKATGFRMRGSREDERL